MTTQEYYQVARWLAESRPRDEEGATVGEKRLWLEITNTLARRMRESYCTAGDRNKFHQLADPSLVRPTPQPALEIDDGDSPF